ncbi:MAG: hypothetical protein ACE5EH_07305 [Gammaproteobacteria bacterium]
MQKRRLQKDDLSTAGLACVIAILFSSCATVQEDAATPAQQPAAAVAVKEVATPETDTKMSAEVDTGTAEAKSSEKTSVASSKKVKPVSEPRPVVVVEKKPAEVVKKPEPVAAPKKEGATPQPSVKVVKKPKAPVKEKPPGQEDLFVVNSGKKNPSHPFFNVGSNMGFIINDVQGRELIVIRGETYRFKVETGVQHDFYLSTSPVGWGAATLTDGVKGNFTYRGIVTFNPGAKTPDTVYYACRNHKNMGAKIHVVNKGEEGKVVLGSKPASAKIGKVSSEPASSVDVNQVKQKISFADMFIMQSGAAKRITASDEAAAKDAYQQAQSKLAEAKKALEGGQAGAAKSLVDEALRHMSKASRLVPTVSQVEEHKARFNELLKGLKTYEDSYKRNYERMVKKKGKENVKRVDLEKINAIVDEAKALADDGSYSEANKLLTKTQTTITSVLSEMLDDETMSYELVFATPAEEYEYELSRYQSYEELIPIAIEQKRPPKQTAELMTQFVEKAKSIQQQAVPEAESKNYKKAILMLQGATGHLQKALRIVGVR